jgi:hypothetical protein
MTAVTSALFSALQVFNSTDVFFAQFYYSVKEVRHYIPDSQSVLG